MWKKTHRNLKNGSEKFPLKVLKGILYDFQREAMRVLLYITEQLSLSVLLFLLFLFLLLLSSSS
jgi:hypothetical protein